MNFTALTDRVVVKKQETTKTNSFGIVILSDNKENTVQGEVFTVGEGKILENGTVIPMTVKQGDTVIYQKGLGIDVKIDDVDYIILHEYEILGILE